MVKEHRMNIYVGNLSFNTDDAELERTFTEFGEVTSARKCAGHDGGHGLVRPRVTWM